MGRIKIDLNALRESGSALNNKINEFEMLNNKMQGLNSSIDSSWQGDAKEAYKNMAIGIFSKQKDLMSILTEFMSYSNNSAETFESVDTDCAARIRNSF